MIPPLEYRPILPRRRDWRIGCVGSGFIMRDCHLVAYRSAGWTTPLAIHSRNLAKASEIAQTFDIPKVHESLDELLADTRIEVLDVAVPPDAQPAIIRRAAESAPYLRGILAQKPLAMTVSEARECVEACERAGITLAVNQNMRYDQSVRAMKYALDHGEIGRPVLATIEMRAIPHWMPWSRGLRSLATYVMSIHHLDTFRYWFGTPQRVLASSRPDPRTEFPHDDGLNLYILEYDNGMRCSGWDDVWTGPCREGSAGDISIRWRIEGEEGLARGLIGWPSYPARTPSTLELTNKRLGDSWHRPMWDEVWFPDAFVGTMAQLLCALENGTTPEISARDNLETLALCEAVLIGAREHRLTTPSEFLER